MQSFLQKFYKCKYSIKILFTMNVVFLSFCEILSFCGYYYDLESWSEYEEDLFYTTRKIELG